MEHKFGMKGLNGVCRGVWLVGPSLVMVVWPGRVRSSPPVTTRELNATHNPEPVIQHQPTAATTTYRCCGVKQQPLAEAVVVRLLAEVVVAV